MLYEVITLCKNLAKPTIRQRLKPRLGAAGVASCALALFPQWVLAQEAPKLSAGDTAWMLTATALVLLMRNNFV